MNKTNWVEEAEKLRVLMTPWTNINNKWIAEIERLQKENDALADRILELERIQMEGK